MTGRGFLVAAPRSGAGKTTVTLGLMRAFRRRGLAVAGAKCGPDYIDPAFHRAATGRDSVNLDSWAMPPALLAGLAAEAARGVDLVVAEALMGLFDGVPGGDGRTGSSADVAAATGWPVVLVLDVSGQSGSAAAVARGFAVHDPRVAIAGVVLNRVGSERHTRLCRTAIEAVGLPVLGALPREASIALPERHLGLVQACETDDLEARLEGLADRAEAHLDLDRIAELARPTAAGDLAAGAGTAGSGALRTALPPPGGRVAVARDAAFAFLYPHILDGWRAAGAELRFFSPLADEAPPADCDACWLSGGYPELHADRLAAAGRFLTGLRDFAAGARVHGECGGFMVLGRSLTDADGTTHAMAGLLAVETSFARRRLHLGYRTAVLAADGPLGRAGAVLRGHEFHYATTTAEGDDAPFAMVADAYGAAPVPAGARRGNVTGSFFHLIAADST